SPPARPPRAESSGETGARRRERARWERPPAGRCSPGRAPRAAAPANSSTSAIRARAGSPGRSRTGELRARSSAATRRAETSRRGRTPARARSRTPACSARGSSRAARCPGRGSSPSGPRPRAAADSRPPTTPPPPSPRARRAMRAAAVSPAHRVEEFLVRLRAAHLGEQELHRVDGVQRVQELPQDPDPVELLLVHQELFLARAGPVDVEAREDALLHQLAVEDDLGVAGALELLEDHLVHARAGVDERGADDGQRAALLAVAGRAEEPLGPVERVGVDAAGEDLAGGRD